MSAEDEDMQDMQDESEESEELQQQNSDNEPSNQLNMNDVQQSVQIHTDEDFSDHDSVIENEDHDQEDDDYDPAAFAANHKRSGSMAEKRESIQQQKRAMEERLRTLSKNLDMATLGGALDEFAEMEEINEDKRIFGELFDKIDPDDNGDVDEKEWIQGLHNLNVQIQESDMAKLFKLMDGDKSGYIDRQDWITFCMTSYNSKELQRLHDSVLNNIKGHSRKPSNMFHAGDAGDWSTSAVANLETQMTQALFKQGVAEMNKAEEEEEYFVSMEREAANNPDWAKPERALEWTPKEVAFWLDTIELSQYARKFDAEQLDGSILLNDCDKTLLQMDMGIKPLHVGKILREVDKLRKINADELQDSYKDWNELIEENQHLITNLETQQQTINELKQENAELRLKSMSAVNLENMANPVASDIDIQKETTKGLYDNNDEVEYKTENNTYTNEINILNEDIEHLHRQKIQFAENTANEISKLNAIIRVLAKEHTTLSTPYYKKFNPVDSIIRSLGYMPNSNNDRGY
eukprot:1014451_1